MTVSPLKMLSGQAWSGLGLYASEEIINRHVKRERKAETYRGRSFTSGLYVLSSSGVDKAYIYIYSKSEGIE